MGLCCYDLLFAVRGYCSVTVMKRFSIAAACALVAFPFGLMIVCPSAVTPVPLILIRTGVSAGSYKIIIMEYIDIIITIWYNRLKYTECCSFNSYT